MSTRLSRLKIDEVSLVTSPANKGARAVVVKRAAETDSSALITDAMRFAAIDEIAKGRGTAITKGSTMHDDLSQFEKASKADLWSAIKDHARQMQAPGETDEQAQTRFMTGTEKGRKLYQMYSVAKGGSLPVEKAAPRDLRKDALMPAGGVPSQTDAYGRLMAKALASKRPEETQNQAFARIYCDKENADLVKLYKAEMAGAVRKASA